MLIDHFAKPCLACGLGPLLPLVAFCSHRLLLYLWYYDRLDGSYCFRGIFVLEGLLKGRRLLSWRRHNFRLQNRFEFVCWWLLYKRRLDCTLQLNWGPRFCWGYLCTQVEGVYELNVLASCSARGKLLVELNCLEWFFFKFYIRGSLWFPNNWIRLVLFFVLNLDRCSRKWTPLNSLSAIVRSNSVDSWLRPFKGRRSVCIFSSWDPPSLQTLWSFIFFGTFNKLWWGCGLSLTV